MTQALNDLPHAQRERLAFIDFSLQFFGHVSRQDIIQRFATGLAAGTRDFALYKQLAEQNLTLDHQSKHYIRSQSFKPLFEHNPDVILHSLSRGFGDGISHQVQPSQQCFDAIALVHPNDDIIASLIRSIHLKCPIDCDYVSLSSGAKRRTLVPHAIVNNGHRWHVRAFDIESQSFRDFVCTRFTRVSLLQRDVSHTEAASQDTNWHREVELALIPHPDLQHPDAIALDFAMIEGIRRVKVRAALAAYVLRHWQVDCSESYRIRGQGCQLALQNLGVLAEIESANLAPGAAVR